MSKVEQKSTRIQEVRDQIIQAKSTGESRKKIQELQQLLDQLINA